MAKNKAAGVALPEVGQATKVHHDRQHPTNCPKVIAKWVMKSAFAPVITHLVRLFRLADLRQVGTVPSVPRGQLEVFGMLADVGGNVGADWENILASPLSIRQ